MPRIRYQYQRDSYGGLFQSRRYAKWIVEIVEGGTEQSLARGRLDA